MLGFRVSPSRNSTSRPLQSNSNEPTAGEMKIDSSTDLRSTYLLNSKTIRWSRNPVVFGSVYVRITAGGVVSGGPPEGGTCPAQQSATTPKKIKNSTALLHWNSC